VKPRRLLVGVLVALLICAAGLASAHGHLDANHSQTCATCALASARARLVAPPSVPPVPLRCVAWSLPVAPAEAPPIRPPLTIAPKHGPPLFS
jgi:hypothetical protein